MNLSQEIEQIAIDYDDFLKNHDLKDHVDEAIPCSLQLASQAVVLQKFVFERLAKIQQRITALEDKTLLTDPTEYP